MLTVIDVLNNGGTIDHAPVSGGIILMDNAGEKATVQITITEFLKLRESGQIKKIDSMRQGHPVFPGQVNFYKRS